MLTPSKDNFILEVFDEEENALGTWRELEMNIK